MEWRWSRLVVLLTTALLLAASVGLPPAGVLGADMSDPRYGFPLEKEEVLRLCQKFQQGGLVFRRESASLTNSATSSALRCSLGTEGVTATVVVTLWNSSADARRTLPEGDIYRAISSPPPADAKRQASSSAAPDGTSDNASLGLQGDVVGDAFAPQPDQFAHLVHGNGTIMVSLYGRKADSGLLHSLIATAKSIVDGKKMQDDYRVSIDYTTTPFEATITVKDAKGNPAPGKSIQVLVDYSAEDDWYKLYPQGGDGALNPYFYTERELVNMLPADDISLHTHREIDQHRRWRTDETGSITVPLYGFTAVDKGGHSLWGYVLRPDRLTPKGTRLPVIKLRIEANLVEKDGDGREEVVATSLKRAELDHVAKLVFVKKGLLLDTTVDVQRRGSKETVKSEHLKPGRQYADGLMLRPGDVITQDELVEIGLKWYSGAKTEITVRERAGKLDIEIRGQGTSVGDAVQRYRGGLRLIGAAGLVCIFVSPVGGAITSVLGFGSDLLGGPEALVGVDIVAKSAILVELADNVDVYTIEGTAEAYDQASANMTEVAAGQTVTLHPDAGFGPVMEFELSDLDDQMLDLVRSAAPELVPETSTDPMLLEPDPTPALEAVPEATALFEDDFDDENDGFGMLDYDAFAHWTVESGTVDLIGNGYYDFYPDAGLILDLDGSRNAGGTLISREAFALTPGHYRLEFDIAGHPYTGPETVTVALGEFFVEDFTMPHDPDLSGFEHVVRDVEFDRHVEARLSFQQHGGDNVGLLLDNIRLSHLHSEADAESHETEPPASAAPTEPSPTPTGAPTPTPTLAPTAAPTEPTRAPPTPAPVGPPATSTASHDLWLGEGDTLTRIDHLSGEVLDRWDVSHPDCPSSGGGQPIVQPDGEAVWIMDVDAEWETPVLECVIRLPLDGSTNLEAYPLPTGREPTFVNDAATQGGDLWAITWKKQDPEGTLEHYADWSLARLDRWSGDLTRVLPRVVALAPSDAGLVVLYSEKGAREAARRPLRLGILEPGGKAPREIPLDVALPRTKPGTYVTPRLRLTAGHEGSVALYDDYAARDIIVFDPASGAVLGRVTPPDGATVIGPVWPVSDGVWMSGLLEGMDDFVRFAPFDGWTSLEVDPCADVAGECYAQVETASDAGAWISAWPYHDAFEVDLDRVVMRRYDTSGQELVEVAGEELFGSS